MLYAACCDPLPAVADTALKDNSGMAAGLLLVIRHHRVAKSAHNIAMRLRNFTRRHCYGYQPPDDPQMTVVRLV